MTYHQVCNKSLQHDGSHMWSRNCPSRASEINIIVFIISILFTTSGLTNLLSGQSTICCFDYFP
jgi:hypothetical protein